MPRLFACFRNEHAIASKLFSEQKGPSQKIFSPGSEALRRRFRCAGGILLRSPLFHAYFRETRITAFAFRISRPNINPEKNAVCFSQKHAAPAGRIRRGDPQEPETDPPTPCRNARVSVCRDTPIDTVDGLQASVGEIADYFCF